MEGKTVHVICNLVGEHSAFHIGGKGGTALFKGGESEPWGGGTNAPPYSPERNPDITLDSNSFPCTIHLNNNLNHLSFAVWAGGEHPDSRAQGPCTVCMHTGPTLTTTTYM